MIFIYIITWLICAFLCFYIMKKSDTVWDDIAEEDKKIIRVKDLWQFIVIPIISPVMLLIFIFQLIFAFFEKYKDKVIYRF